MSSLISILLLFFIAVSSNLYLAAAFSKDEVSDGDKEILRALHDKFKQEKKRGRDGTIRPGQYGVLYFGAPDVNSINNINTQDEDCLIEQEFHTTAKNKKDIRKLSYILQPEYGFKPDARDQKCKFLAALVGGGNTRHAESSVLWSFYKDEAHSDADVTCPSPPEGGEGNLYMFTPNTPCTEYGGAIPSDTFETKSAQKSPKYEKYPTCSRIITEFAYKCSKSFKNLIIGYIQDYVKDGVNTGELSRCRINAAENAVLVYPGPWPEKE